jgi:ATP-dependent DNA ligase
MRSICWSSTAADLRREPWEARRARLANLLRKARVGVRLSEHLDSDGALAFAHACRLGLEGIVAKRRDRPYRSGRCADWIKVKNRAHPSLARAELIVLSKQRQARRIARAIARLPELLEKSEPQQS